MITKNNFKELEEVIKKSNRSQLDYIRSISIEGDNDIFINEIKNFIETEEDLSIKIRDNIILIRKLNWDTEFFGFTTAKVIGFYNLNNNILNVEDYNKLIQSMNESLYANQIKYVLWLLDARDIKLIQAACQHGYILIESRLHYYIDLNHFENPERYSVRLANNEDIIPLSENAINMVNEYDRFHSDDFFSRESVDRLMAKWVETSIMGNFADGAIVPNVEKPKAFCTFKMHKDKWPFWKRKISQPVFSAVGVEFRGWYKKIISELNYYLRDNGAEFAYLITQSTNKAVIHTWESLGYKFGKNELVFRKIL